MERVVALVLDPTFILETIRECLVSGSKKSIAAAVDDCEKKIAWMKTRWYAREGRETEIACTWRCKWRWHLQTNKTRQWHMVWSGKYQCFGSLLNRNGMEEMAGILCGWVGRYRMKVNGVQELELALVPEMGRTCFWKNRDGLDKGIALWWWPFGEQTERRAPVTRGAPNSSSEC